MIDDRGHVVTNDHVVAGGGKVTVGFGRRDAQRKTAAEIERELAAKLGRDRLEALKSELTELGDLTANWRSTPSQRGARAGSPAPRRRRPVR